MATFLIALTLALILSPFTWERNAAVALRPAAWPRHPNQPQSGCRESRMHRSQMK
ncbi:hypothetical protein [Nitratireductor sp. GCM10026969]|uniref:hypothetical protein n=1 Tax=Nitratireductor sp. GCM10026969 TaxID=3252645 RepID=UPI00360B501D